MKYTSFTNQLFLTLILFLVGLIPTTNLMAQNEAMYASYTNNPLVKRIISLDKTVKDKGAIVGFLTAQHLDKLPIGIMDPSGKVVICIDSAKFTPNGGTFNAYAAIQLPGTKEKMCFRATGIPFGPNGITANDAPTLTLVSSHVLKIGNKVDLVLPGNGNNNVKWNCNGFQELNMEGLFVFKKGFFIPDTLETRDTTVTASFSLQHVVNINNMLASISITPFKIKGMEDFAFQVTQATVDMSDYANPANFNFPANYLNEFGSNVNLWRGFSLKNITVRTPFNKKGGLATFTIDNMLIDESGVSGIIGATNLFDAASGSADGWQFGIDKISLEILRNRLTGGAIEGNMKLPFLGDDSLGYKAVVSQWNEQLDYMFQVKLTNADTFKMPFGLKTILNAGSYVQLQKYQGNFVASALLNGGIYSDSGASKFKGIRFEHLGLSTKSPFVHSGYFVIANSIATPSLGGFKISIDSIRLGIVNGQIQLGASVALSFMADTARGFGARAGFIYKGHFEQDSIQVKRQRFVSDGLTINEIGIKVRYGSFDLDGLVKIHRNDPVYGDGFRGNVMIKFTSVGEEVKLAAQAYFGTKDDFKYFQISGFAQMGTGVAVLPPILFLDGFLGGLSYHMTKPQNLKSPTLVNNEGGSIGTPDDWARQVYVPNPNVGFGILLGTTFYAGTKSLASGGIALEIELNNNWGVNYVNFKGTVAVFKNITSEASPSLNNGSAATGSPMYAEFNVNYDRPNKTLHANSSTYLNLGVLVGIGPNNRFGELVLHIDPQNWYYYLGRPTSPMGIKIKLGGFLDNLLTAQAYFMVGSQLDPFPLPPPEILNNISNYQAPSQNDLKSGGGIAFGAKIAANANIDLRFFYAYLRAGIGGDVILSNSGNRSCNGEAVGFDGWWAKGQVYVYIEGGAGVRARALGVERDFKIVSLAIGALLEAKVPKPNYFSGHAYVSWYFLGGLVTGNINLHVNFGTDCAVVEPSNPNPPAVINYIQPQADPPTIKLIENIYVSNNNTSVDLDGIPAITTNFPVDTEFEILNSEGANEKFKLKAIRFDYVKNKVNSSGASQNDVVLFTQKFLHDNKKVILIQSNKSLEAESDYTISGTYSFTKQLGRWDTSLNITGTPNYDTLGNAIRNYISDGTWTTIYEETKSLQFKTIPNSTVIDMSKVDYAYPSTGMKNFYKEEYAEGCYIKINNSVDMNKALYVNRPGDTATYEYRMRYTPLDGAFLVKTDVPFTIDGHLLKYTLPPGIEKNKSYHVGLLRRKMYMPEGNDYLVAAGTILSQSTNSGTGFTDTTAGYNNTIVTTVLQNPVAYKEVELLGFDFRLSKYNTFADKLNSFTHVDNIQDIAQGNVLLIGERKQPTDELFDKLEINSLIDSVISVPRAPANFSFSAAYASNFPMIKAEALPGNYWLDSIIIPSVYPTLTTVTSDETFFRNDVAGNGNLPAEYTYNIPYTSIALEQNDYAANYTGQNALDYLNSGIASLGTAKFIIKYNMPYYLNKDFNSIYNIAALKWSTGLSTKFFTQLVETGGIFPQILNGTYKVKLTYKTPGGIHASEHLVDVTY